MRSLIMIIVVCTCIASAVAEDVLRPVGVHQLALEAHRGVPTNPDLLGRPGEMIRPLRLRDAADRPCRIVFGYLPYWESAANIRWDILTHLACFSVEVNANGTLGNDHNWPWTSVINTAHDNDVKVILVATLFNSSNILTLITNSTYKAAFFANIRDKMLEGGADGLNIDFESGSSWQGHINQFMAELTAYLHAEIPGCEVTIAGPAVNWSSVWDLGGLAESCDGIFIMGYAFAGSWSTTSGANAPFIGGTINITDTIVDEYVDAALENPDKLILGVPYYGHHWITSSSAARATVVSFVSSTRFRDDQVSVGSYGRLWDTASQTPWYRWNTGGQWHQVWYDDAESLRIKYALARGLRLGGVGMWALNYDGTRDELWNELDDYALAPCCAEAAVTPETIFHDDFDAGTSGLRWTPRSGSADYTADFAYDYSVRGIPPAPRSVGGTTLGARFTANNNDATPAAAAVSAFPTGRWFEGDHVLRFDAWINYNGGAGGGSGSTEFLTVGVLHGGQQVVWPNNPAADGHMFAVSGEGGATEDYRAHDGPTMYAELSGVYPPRDQDHTAPYYAALFPTPTFQTLGAPGKRWVEVEIASVGGRVEWRIDGALLAVIEDAGATEGNVMIGYMDVYSSIANPSDDNFAIVDNVRVESLSAADCNGNGSPDACDGITAGDFDGDGAIGAGDAAGFVECLGGPDAPAAPQESACAASCLSAFDADGDGDVDLCDFGAFAVAFN